ncbi:hypothetical protein QFC20_004326 [Naganishia adeliensis]|uniref:Uncharacterized protein n=1 Tax=Naganishia adeliensis TaxID=92952 RepID=A0ACC2W2W2_9TREE|nr:hypothetical protein QFC20_004326 [Naganishia adeliensis]
MNPALDRLDAALECPICKHAFEAPVSLACGHSFCSRCIRDALQERKECPVCREEAREGQVRRNRVVEELVGAWTGLRDDILRLSLPPPKRKSSLPPPPAKRRRTTPPPASHPPNGEAIVLDLDSDDDDVVVSLDDPPSAQTDSRTRVDPPTGLISCPACAQQLPLTSLNAHLDRGCPPVGPANGSSTSAKAWAALFSAPGPSRGDADAELLSKRITKPNYALASTKELRGLLETYGCPTAGERAVANLDASNPRPLKSLRTELEVQERARNRDKEDAGRAKQAFVNATDDDEAFKRLEKELRARRKKGEQKGG